MNKLFIAILLLFLGVGKIMGQWEYVDIVACNLQLTSPKIGYYYDNIGGGTPSNPRGQGFLYKSVDGWNSWTCIATVGSEYDVGYIEHMQFFNDTVGTLCAYILGFGGLRHTPNGGASWISILGGPPHIVSVFTNPKFGYYRTFGFAGPGLYLYNNGVHTIQDSSFVGINPMHSLTFLNDSVGFFIPEWTNPPVFRTEDYGKTWQRTGDTTWIAERIIIQGKNCFYLSTSSDLYFSEDMGISWTPAGTIPMLPINDLYFLNADTGWAAGKNGRILKTTSGGAQWEESIVEPQDEIIKIRYFSDSVGYYISRQPHFNSYQYLLYRTEAGPWGISESEIIKPIKILQNPVRSDLIITCSIPHHDISSMQIISINGKLLFHSEIYTDKIDLSSFSDGIYLLRYVTAKGTFTEKFILKR